MATLFSSRAVLSRSGRLPSLLGWLCLTGAVGLVGAQFPPTEWYQSLDKPSFIPPSVVFMVVWPLLFLLMAIAAWMVQHRESAPEQDRRNALRWMLVQLLLNLAWTPLFFGLQRPLLAFVDICLLWLSVGITLGYFASIRVAAAWLFTPYFLWVSFALVLNGAIWLMNVSG